MEEIFQDKVQKIYSGKISDKELNQFRDLFLHAENEYEIKQVMLKHLQEFELEGKNLPDFDKLYSSIRQKIAIEGKKSKKPFQITWVTRLTRIAAILLLAILTGALSYYFMKPQSDFTTVIRANTASVAYTVLPDGSQLYLNSGSKLTYDPSNWNKKRIVKLSGEAWFHIKTNETKPFVVTTPFYNINVTGTKFNVKAYEDELYATTTLESGKVKIISSDKLKLAEEITLNPGEQFILNEESKEVIIKKVNTEWFTSWKENKLIMIDMKFQELCKLLERKYGVDIIIKDQLLLNLHFNGTIRNETIFQILDILKATLPIDYEIVDQKIEITTK